MKNNGDQPDGKDFKAWFENLGEPASNSPAPEIREIAAVTEASYIPDVRVFRTSPHSYKVSDLEGNADTAVNINIKTKQVHGVNVESLLIIALEQMSKQDDLHHAQASAKIMDALRWLFLAHTQAYLLNKK